MSKNHGQASIHQTFMAGLQEIQFMVRDWSTELPIQSWPKDCQPLKKLWRYWLIRGYHISQIGDDRQSYWWSMVISPSQSSPKYGGKTPFFCWEKPTVPCLVPWFRSSMGFGHTKTWGCSRLSRIWWSSRPHLHISAPRGSTHQWWQPRWPMTREFFSCEFLCRFCWGDTHLPLFWGVNLHVGVHGRGLYHPTFCAAWPEYGWFTLA